MKAIETITNLILCLIKWIFSLDGSQVIYNLGLGIGGIIGAIVGGKVLKEQMKRKMLIQKYSKQYHHKLFNTKDGWQLTQNPYTLGDIYILDHRSKTKHWIANYQTLLDLPIPQRDLQLTEEKAKLFKEYKEGKEIITTGKPEPS